VTSKPADRYATHSVKGHTTNADAAHGSPSRTTRSRTKPRLPLRAKEGGVNKPARKKNPPITNKPVGPITAVSANSTGGVKATSFTSSYGQPPTAE